MDKRENEYLIKNWDIGELISCKKTKKGVVNINWIVKTTKGKYVLRKTAKFTRIKDLKFELSYLTYLKEHNFPCRIPNPIISRNKRFFLRFKGHYFWIYEYIEGRDIERFGHSELKECAKMTAIYHKIIERSNLDNKKGNGDVFGKIWITKELEKLRTQILKKDKQDRKDKIFLEESSKLILIIKNLDERDYSKIPRYPIHRDINPENTLWKNKKLVGLIDFENVGTMNDTLIKDISGMLQYSCRDKLQKYKLNLKLAKFFLKEYKKYHQLSNKKIEFIPDIITAGSIEDFCWTYWMLVNDPKRARLYRLKLYSQVAQWCNKNKEEIIENLKM